MKIGWIKREEKLCVVCIQVMVERLIHVGSLDLQKPGLADYLCPDALRLISWISKNVGLSSL